MSDHFLFQKSLAASVRDTGLTPGQPKILDYLINHDGAIQREIAVSCHIEPASLTTILNGMENKGYIERRTDGGIVFGYKSASFSEIQSTLVCSVDWRIMSGHLLHNKRRLW